MYSLSTTQNRTCNHTHNGQQNQNIPTVIKGTCTYHFTTENYENYLHHKLIAMIQNIPNVLYFNTTEHPLITFNSLKKY